MAPSPVQRPTTAEIRSIVAIDDPVVRNLRITECYARLSAALRALVGDGANWCTFATWASLQAGCTIRGEDFGDRLAQRAREKASILQPIRSLWRMLLRRGIFRPTTTLGGLVHQIHSPFDAIERASEAVAIGNRKVFEEIGFEFTRYLEFRSGARPLSEFLAALRSGPPPEGQDLLRSAFLNYEQARAEADPIRRAQLMLLANLQIGFHEQTRLQPEIQRAMEAGPDTVVDLKQRLALHFGGGLPAAALAAVAAGPALSYRRFVREQVRRVLTDALMVLRTPDGTLQLGRDLEAEVPPELKNLDHTDLRALLHTVEPEICPGCGAEDWASLQERMHYIFHLFRALHSRSSLFDSPFAPEQIVRIRAGQLPSGRL